MLLGGCTYTGTWCERVHINRNIVSHTPTWQDRKWYSTPENLKLHNFYPLQVLIRISGLEVLKVPGLGYSGKRGTLYLSGTRSKTLTWFAPTEHCSTCFCLHLISECNPPSADCTVHVWDRNKIIKRYNKCYAENAGGFCIYLFSHTHARTHLWYEQRRREHTYLLHRDSQCLLQVHVSTYTRILDYKYKWK